VFERFTERARQVVVLAQEEARTLKHNYIGTEHILLGLLREEEGLAARVLESLDITVERVRARVVRIVGSGEEVASGQIPFTPEAKKTLEMALRESQSLGCNYIGTEHLLLGMARENEGVGTRILLDFDVDSERIRNEVVRMLSGPGPQRSETRPPMARAFDASVRVGPAAGVRRLLMKAAARSLDDGRTAVELRDLLLALTRDEHCAPLLSEFGINEETMREAIDRGASPPQTEGPGPED
jgi:ATP-dependent Clp protease ATP-binding subunit ClpC